LILNRKD